MSNIYFILGKIYIYDQILMDHIINGCHAAVLGTAFLSKKPNHFKICNEKWQGNLQSLTIHKDKDTCHLQEVLNIVLLIQRR